MQLRADARSQEGRLSCAQIIEIVLHVALNTLTNYASEVAKTETDFPAVTAKAA